MTQNQITQQLAEEALAKVREAQSLCEELDFEEKKWNEFEMNFKWIEVERKS